MELSRADTDAAVVLRVGGSISSFDGPELSAAVAKAMVDASTCLVCDLSAVTWLDPVCVAVWVGAQWSGPWPGPVLWLVGAEGQPTEALRATGAALFLVLADSPQAAITQQLREPPLRRDRLLLAPLPTAPSRARRFATEVLALWSISELTDDAVLIVSELVTNGVQHAATDLELRLELGRGLLRIAVRDDSRFTPSFPNTDVVPGRSGVVAELRERGRGLRIVRALAVASGRTSTPMRGSVYWATLRSREGPSRP